MRTEIKMPLQLRIARSVSNLEQSVTRYRHGLGLEEFGRFEDHEGFDGVMLGKSGLDYHLEFTYCRTHPVNPVPTPEDFLVFYFPEMDEWQEACAHMLAADFIEVASGSIMTVIVSCCSKPIGFQVARIHAALKEKRDTWR